MIATALTQHQCDAIEAVLHLLEYEPVVALRRMAGPGKSTLCPHLLDRLPRATVVAATNKVAAVEAGYSEEIHLATFNFPNSRMKNTETDTKTSVLRRALLRLCNCLESRA
jgi:hypothetical protein